MPGALVCLAAVVWMCVKIWKSSPLLAILSLIFTPVLLYAVVKYWGDEKSDIRVPFFVGLAGFGYLVFVMLGALH